MSALAAETYTPYSTLQGMLGASLSFLGQLDSERVRSYQVYQQIYDIAPNTWTTVSRGTEDQPVYLPTPKTVINTVNRYLAPALGFAVDGGEDGDGMAAILSEALAALFKRERFYSKFAANKRYGVIRGDWCFHIIGNEAKEQGRRLTIQTLDPASYFPVSHPDDPDRIIAAHIFEMIETEPGSNEYVMKRQTYQRGIDPVGNDGSDTTIYNSIATFDVEDWQDISASPVKTIKPIEPLPDEITAIPIYHIRHNPDPSNPWGQSEFKSLERTFAALNQAISDEEMALAYQGLGLYHTDGPPPEDEDGNETDWLLGPGRVVETALGRKFNRVEGVTSVVPMQQHIEFLKTELKESVGLSDVAIGKSDASTAESGIALMVQLGPILSKSQESESEITDVLTQMFWDLKSWLMAYESVNTGVAFAIPTYGNPIPVNKQQEFDNVMALVEKKIVSVEWAVRKLQELGYEIDPSDFAKVAEETATLAAAEDPVGSRIGAEADAEI